MVSSIIQNILQNYNEGNLVDLESELFNLSLESILDAIDEQIIRKPCDDSVEIIKAIFFACNQSKRKFHDCILSVIKHSLKLVCNPEVSSKVCLEIVGLLILEIDHLSANDLSNVCNDIVESIRKAETGNGYALQILPKLLYSIQDQREMHNNNGTMSGIGFKKHLINSICSIKWSGKCALHLATTFKDVEMDNDETLFVIKKVVRQLTIVKLQEIPPLVHQLLLLSPTKYDEIIYGIIQVFDDYDNKCHDDEVDINLMDDIEAETEANSAVNQKELCTVLGTVLLHINNMARLNAVLIKSVVKRLKLEKESLTNISTIFISICLSLCNAKVHSEEVLAILKSIVFKSHQAKHKQENSKWLQNRETEISNVHNILMNIINYSRNGWDHITVGLVQLGFILMDSYGPKPCAFGRKLEEKPLYTNSPQQKSCDTGIKILAETFKTHSLARVEIIDCIFKRIISSGISAPISHYVAVLHGISKRYANIMLETKSKIKSFFEYLNYLSPINCSSVLQSLMPIVRLNSNIKDTLILILRKMLFSSDENNRVIAANGFTLLLQNFKVSGQISLSQASSQSSQSIFSISSQILVDAYSSSNSYNSQSKNNEPLCLEVLSTLRRCLTQQSQVRITLYKGIWQVLNKNKNLSSPSIEVLLNHLKQYYEDDDDILPPIALDKCVALKNDDPVMVENLPLLLSCIYSSLREVIQENDSEDYGLDDEIVEEHIKLKIQEIFKSLSLRLCKCEIEDFELDKSADFSSKTSVGRKNGIIADLLLGVYEVVIEFTFLNGAITEEKAQRILKLFQCYKYLHDLVQTRKDIINKTNFTPKYLQQILILLVETDQSEDQEAINILVANDDFFQHMLLIVQMSVAYAKEHGNMFGISGNHSKTIHNSITTIGKYCLAKFITDRNKPDKDAIVLLCIKIFNNCLSYTFARNKKNINDFFADTNLNDTTTTAESSSMIALHVKRFQRVLLSILSEDISMTSADQKIFHAVIESLAIITSIYTDGSYRSWSDGDTALNSSTPFPPLVTYLNEWIGKICTEYEIDDVSISKALLQLHFDLVAIVGPWESTDKATRGCECVLRDISIDIRKLCGNIDEDDDSQNSEEITSALDNKKYKMVTQANFPHIIPLIVNKIDVIVEEIDSVLQRLKGQVTAHLAMKKLCFVACSEKNNQEEEEFQEKRRKMESSICPRLGTLLVAYKSFIKSALPLGNFVENVLKGLGSLFNVIKQFTRYYIWLISQGVIKAPPSRYENLIKLSGSEVTQFVYNFINHVNSEQDIRTEKYNKRMKKSGKSDSIGEKSRIIRETRAIPPLIYAIESFEHYVITLGKKCKLNLMSSHHLPTSRDFRLKNDVIRDIIESREGENASIHSDDDHDSESNTSSSPKRSRLNN